MSKPVVLTGIRSNEDPTIGNYFGAILPLIDLAKSKSEDFDINIFVPDLHSFTTPVDHTKLYDQTIHNLKIFVASGLPLDSSDVHIFRQSFIPAHSELTWILDCFTGFGELCRMTQFKDKSSKLDQDRISVGLFNYPVLMAADILIYGASYVPVGDDQSQHLEFARDVAQRFNNRFGNIFTVPESVKDQHNFFGKDQGLRIMDLADPNKKMSKSDENGKGVIFLKDSPEEAHKKVMTATTDNVGVIHFDRVNQPGISNLLEILALLRHDDLSDIIAEFEGKTRYGEFKELVANEVSKFLVDFHAKLDHVNPDTLFDKLESDEATKAVIANAKLYEVQKAVGLRK